MTRVAGAVAATPAASPVASSARETMLLAWGQDVTPLTVEDGPLRLVVPGDLRGGRYVRGVVSIEMRSIAEPAV